MGAIAVRNLEKDTESTETYSDWQASEVFHEVLTNARNKNFNLEEWKNFLLMSNTVLQLQPEDFPYTSPDKDSDVFSKITSATTAKTWWEGLVKMYQDVEIKPIL